MKKSDKVNYVQKPIPASAGKNQVTYEDLKAEKGGSMISSKMPTKGVVPGGDSKK